MKNNKFYTIALLSLFLLTASAHAQTAEILPMSGGSFTMTKSVIADGGGETQNTSTAIHSTIGQPNTDFIASGQFSIYSGFWTPENQVRGNEAQMEAVAIVGGRVLTADGRGIRNVEVTIKFANGETRSVSSSMAGYYRFAGIPKDETYVVGVAAKKYTFSQPTQVRQVLGDIQDIDFVADARNSITTEAQPQ